LGIARPNSSQAVATNECAAKCDQGDGSAEDTQKFSDCVQSCISSLFPSSQTANIPGAGAAASGSAATGSGASGSAAATGSNRTFHNLTKRRFANLNQAHPARPPPLAVTLLPLPRLLVPLLAWKVLASLALLVSSLLSLSRSDYKQSAHSMLSGKTSGPGWIRGLHVQSVRVCGVTVEG
jgi:hypothetical protein